MKVYLAKHYGQAKEIVAKLVAQEPATLESKVTVFCEDKFTMALEKSIAKACGGGFNHKVSSFNLFMRDNAKEKNVISSRSSSIVVRKILLDNKDKLKYLYAKEKPNLAISVYELIAQLKSAGVKPKDLLVATEKTNGVLKTKLRDLYVVFSEYERYLEEGNVYDGNNYLSLMPEIIRKSKQIPQTKVILCGYPSVTWQSAEIFKAFMQTAKECCFVVISGENTDVYLNETLQFLKESGQVLDIIETSAGLCKEAEVLTRKLFRPEEPPVSQKTSNVTVYRAGDYYEELSYVAKQISLLVKENGVRYRDVNVIAGNLQAYRIALTGVFKEYGIPYYVDEQISLYDHPLIKFIKDLISVAIKNFDMDCVLQTASSGILIEDKKKSDAFASYCNAFAVTRRSIKEPFTEDSPYLKEAEEVRSKIVTLASKFLKSGLVKDHVEVLAEVLKEAEAEQNLQTVTEKLSLLKENVKVAFNEQAFDKFSTVLKETVEILGEEKVSLKEFLSVIESASSSCKINLIPQYYDAVYIGDFASSRYVSADYTFATGMSSDVPFRKADVAFLSDGDLLKLDGIDVVIEPKIKIVNKRQKESVCMSLISFGKKLFLSYSVLDYKGKEDVASCVIDEIIRIFNLEMHDGIDDAQTLSLSEEGYEDGKTNSVIGYLSPKPALKSFIKESNAFKTQENTSIENLSAYYQALSKLNDEKRLLKAEKILEKINGKASFTLDVSDEEVNDLCFYNSQLSVTTLEDYFACPYKSFLKHALKIKEDEDGNVQANQYGSILHSVLENFVNKVKEVGKEESFSVEKEAEEIFDKEISKDDYSKYLKKKQYVTAFEMLKTEAIKVCEEIYGSYKNSNFLPFGAEIAFGEGKEFLPIKIIDGDKEYKIRGIVDRVDVCGDYIRIVDYKSGKIKEGNFYFFGEKLFYAGKKLQLYLYMNAFTQDGKYKPAGLYYSAVNDDYSDVDKEVVKTKLMGKTLADGEVVKNSDLTLTEGKSSLINAELKIGKNGELLVKGESLSEEEMQGYLLYSKKVAKKAVKRIREGFIEPSPFKGSCMYCKYKGICGYDETTDFKTRDPQKPKPSQIVEASKEEMYD